MQEQAAGSPFPHRAGQIHTNTQKTRDFHVCLGGSRGEMMLWLGPGQDQAPNLPLHQQPQWTWGQHPSTSNKGKNPPESRYASAKGLRKMRKMVSKKEQRVKSIAGAQKPSGKTTLGMWSVRKGVRNGVRKLLQLNREQVQEDILLH